MTIRMESTMDEEEGGMEEVRMMRRKGRWKRG